MAKDDLTDESEFANFTVVKNWAAMKEKLAMENKTNFLKDHVKAVGEYGIIQKERLSLNKEMRINLLERAQIKRQQQDEYEHKMKYFKLFRWALIQNHKREMEEAQRIRTMKMLRSTKAAKMMYAFLIYRAINEKFI